MSGLKRRGPKPKAKAPPSGIDRESYLRGELDEAHADIDAARAAESWQAVAALRRQALYISEELGKIEAARLATPGGRDWSTASREEMLERTREIAQELPDVALEIYVRAYMDRHGLKLLGASGGRP